MAKPYFTVKDIKEQYELRAQEIADEEYNMEYYDLSDEEQVKVYNKAMSYVHEGLVLQAEAIIDYLKEV